MKTKTKSEILKRLETKLLLMQLGLKEDLSDACKGLKRETNGNSSGFSEESELYLEQVFRATDEYIAFVRQVKGVDV